MAHQHKHFHDMMVAKRAPEMTTEGGTVLSIVYVTASPTFTGVIGGYTTLSGEAVTTTQSSDAQESAAASSSRSSADSQSQSSSSADASASSSTGSEATSSSNSVSTSQASTAASLALTSSVATTFSTSTAPSYLVGSSSNTAVATATDTSSSSTDGSSSSTTSSGMSTGAKAGLAIAILAVVGIIAALMLWFLGKKRREREAAARADNEKSTFGAGGAASGNTSSSLAPRLSLRPMSRMMPEFIGRPKSRLSNGNMLNTIGESGTAESLTPAPLQPRAPSPLAPMMNEKSHPNNPFNDPQNPFADPQQTVAPAFERAPAPAIASLATFAGAAAVSVSAVPAVRSGMNREPQSPITKPAAASISSTPAPRAATTQAPMSSAIAPGPVIAQGPGPEAPQGNVYRVLMDFRPSMDDELELISGQLVRLLHEYDDGWALCIRLDRSHQGVVPRTCLADKPSKPKPSHLNQYASSNSPQPLRPGPNPPMSPSMSRPMPPAGSPRGRMDMASPRSANFPNTNDSRSEPGNLTPRMQPAGRPMSPGVFNRAPRPLSPGPRPQQRSMSPGPYGAAGPKPMAGTMQRRRSNSASALNVRDRRNSPAGPSRLGPNGGSSRSESPGIAL